MPDKPGGLTKAGRFIRIPNAKHNWRKIWRTKFL